jgi:deoxyribodipyrimidine photo-lyase
MKGINEMRAIYWVREDLRIHDNQALHEFCKSSQEGIVVWCPTPSFLRAGGFRKLFILQSLEAFKRQAEMLGTKVLVQDQSAVTVLPNLVKSLKVDRVFFSASQTTEEKREEEVLFRELGGRFIASEPRNTLLNLSDLHLALEALPEVFTQFRKLVEASLKVRSEIPLPGRLPPPFPIESGIDSFDLSSEISSLISNGFQNKKVIAGEAGALKRLEYYLWESNRIQTYKETRNGLLDWEDSSKLSPYLAVGSISPRRIFFELKRYELERMSNESTYWLFFELLWRDYFKFNAEKLGARIFGGLNPPPIRSQEFERWSVGETDDSFVNANMRELNATGWMSNRGRQNVASYLAKTLRGDWRLGAQYFEKQLIDYDASSNWGNWSYLAGVGQDPRNRVFNTGRQASIYDPNGEYQKKWSSDHESS